MTDNWTPNGRKTFQPRKKPKQPTKADQILRLLAALHRIDGINDNPACYNPMIDEVLRGVLETKP